MVQLSDDCFAHGGRLMRTTEALALLEKRLSRVTQDETLPLRAALCRILTEDVLAAQDVPPSDNAAVDGYAVYFDDLNAESETALSVAGRAAAGHPMKEPAQRGAAVRIFTGAVVPPGPDTIIMQEDCQLRGTQVVIPPGLRRGANHRAAGEDLRAGDRALARGQRLRPQDLGLAAAVGRKTLRVSQALKVALFSTGDELAEPGESLPPGAIYDSNRFTLMGLLEGLGCRVSDLGILPDKGPEVTEALREAARGHEAIITSGGVSVGEEDHVKAAVETLGSLYAWRLAIKPGRPLALGQVAQVPFLGLPGNPVAVVVTFLILARPALLRLMGARDLLPHRFTVTAGFDYRKKKERREWVRVTLTPLEDGGWRAERFPREGSGILSSLVAADGLVELPEDLTGLSAGAMVDFLPFSEVL